MARPLRAADCSRVSLSLYLYESPRHTVRQRTNNDNLWIPISKSVVDVRTSFITCRHQTVTISRDRRYSFYFERLSLSFSLKSVNIHIATGSDQVEWRKVKCSSIPKVRVKLCGYAILQVRQINHIDKQHSRSRHSFPVVGRSRRAGCGPDGSG